MSSDRDAIQAVIDDWMSGAGGGVITPTALDMLRRLILVHKDRTTLTGACDALLELSRTSLDIRVALLKANGYREVNITDSNLQQGDRVIIRWKGSELSVALTNTWLAQRNIQPGDLRTDDLRNGIVAYIKGTKGNEDKDVWGVDTLNDMKLYRK